MSNSPQQQQQQHQKAPYRPTIWSLGGTPEIAIDVPVTAVFLALFMIGAATHMTIFQLNRRRGHKFLFNAVIFGKYLRIHSVSYRSMLTQMPFIGFCMSRIVTCILRIASICLPNNINLLIAASIFVAAGVLILFIINLIWAQRILRSLHPHIGWHTALSIIFRAVFVLVGCTLAILITSVVQTYFTLDPHIRSIDRSLQLYGQTYFAIVSSLPLLVLFVAFVIPRKTSPDPFGKGTLQNKTIVLIIGSVLLSTGAWYRCGTSWKHQVPRSHPLPAYFDRAAFYVFNFALEIMTVYLYAIMRMDLRFHVPNGAKGPGSYSSGNTSEKVAEEEIKR